MMEIPKEHIMKKASTSSPFISPVTYPRLLHPVGRNPFDLAESTPSNLSSHHANSGKRRQAVPDLSRTGTTPSHRVKMAQIFQDAALELATPSRRLSSNTRRFRDPLASSAHALSSTKASRASHRPTTPPDLHFEKIFPTPPIPQKLYENTVLPLSIEPDEYEDECHSSHRVPLVISMRLPQTPKMTNTLVDAWLDDVLALSPHPAFKEKPLPRGDQHPCRTLKKCTHHTKVAPSRVVSNKENIAPSTAAVSWSDVASLRQAETSGYPSPIPYQSSESSSNRILNSRNVAISDSRFQYADDTHSLLSLPPKFEQNKVSAKPKVGGTSPKTPFSSLTKFSYPDRGHRFQACEDEESGGLVKLSPAVECFRKGKGPKRERCPSYHDQDIFPAFSPIPRKGRRKVGGEEVKKGRRVLEDKKEEY